MNSSAAPEPNLPEPDWDFDISTFLGQNVPVGEISLDLGGYFDFTQSFLPLSSGPWFRGLCIILLDKMMRKSPSGVTSTVFYQEVWARICITLWLDLYCTLHSEDLFESLCHIDKEIVFLLPLFILPYSRCLNVPVLLFSACRIASSLSLSAWTSGPLKSIETSSII